MFEEMVTVERKNEFLAFLQLCNEEGRTLIDETIEFMC